MVNRQLGLNENLCDAVCDTLPNLSQDFLPLADEFLMRDWWDTMEGHTLAGFTNTNDIAPLTDIVRHLVGLKDGLQAAFDFLMLICKSILYTFRNSDFVHRRHQLLVLLDELLLELCKACASLATLIRWRTGLLRVRVGLEPQVYRAVMLMPRSARYMQEAQARETHIMVTKKVIGHLLPPELVDMVRTCLSAARNVADLNKRPDVWAAFLLQDSGNKVATTFDKCCRLRKPDPRSGSTQHSFGNTGDIHLWSDAEHRYVRYHAARANRDIKEAVYCMRTKSVKDLKQGDVVFRRCKQQVC